MLSNRAITTYALACILAASSLVTGIETLRVPWLVDKKGSGIWLWKRQKHKGFVDFPDHFICKSNTAFCASWQTATFFLTLALATNTLVLLALAFSWGFHHRKKTVIVVRYLLFGSLGLQMVGLLLWTVAYSKLGHVWSSHKYYLANGWMFSVTSCLLNLALFALTVPFRSLVKNPLVDTDIDEDRQQQHHHQHHQRYRDLSDVSDNDMSSSSEDEIDDVSIPDDIPEHQIDYYVFTKRARRRELARLTGSTV